MVGGTMYFPHNGDCHPFSGLAEDLVVEMGVAVGGGSPPMSEQSPRDMQALAVHDRVRGVRMPQVM